MKLYNRLKTALGLRRENTRNWRPQWLPRSIPLTIEAHIHPHVDEERAELFLAYDAGSAEIEVLNWLYATICLVKPEKVLETGAARGLGLVAMGKACRDNGMGKVYSVELDEELCKKLRDVIKKEALEEWVEVVCEDSIKYLGRTEHIFDIGFFDSMCEIRSQEYMVCMERGRLRKMAIFHDTSEYRTQSLKGWPDEKDHKEYRAKLKELATDARVKGYFENTLSRGLFAIYL